jgi:hypothetical protein
MYLEKKDARMLVEIPSEAAIMDVVSPNDKTYSLNT